MFVFTLCKKITKKGTEHLKEQAEKSIELASKMGLITDDIFCWKLPQKNHEIVFKKFFLVYIGNKIQEQGTEVFEKLQTEIEGLDIDPDTIPEFIEERKEEYEENGWNSHSKLFVTLQQI